MMTHGCLPDTARAHTSSRCRIPSACSPGRFFACLLVPLLWLLLPASTLSGAPAAPPQTGDAPGDAAVARGKYVFRATGGCGCHTDFKHDGPFLAGGRALKTPFGTFYSTNITPHRETGLGAWEEADFIRAMRRGVGPDGTHYFPVFPYPAFTRMREADLRDLWAYLRSVPPVERRNRRHEVMPPFGWRLGLPVWKWLFFTPGPYSSSSGRSADWNRGAYLALALGHCEECHTPRNLLGALRESLRMAGSRDGPEGELAPNLTPDEETGIGGWSEADLVWFLETGLKPDGDDAQGLMAEMIENGYKHLEESDRRALYVYLRTLPPVRRKVKAPEKK